MSRHVTGWLVVLMLFGACGNPDLQDTLTERNSAEHLGVDEWLITQVGLSDDGGELAIAGLSSVDGAGIGVSRGGPLRFFSGPHGSPPMFAWLPGGETLLLSENNTRDELASGGAGSQLTIVDRGGVAVRRIALEPAVTLSGGLAVTSDGSTAVAGVFFEASDSTTDLASIDLESGVVTRLTSTPGLNEGSPSTLADGSIVYSAGPSNFDPESPSQVRILDVAGGTRALTDKTFTAPFATASDDGVVVFLGRQVTSDRIELALWKTDTEGARPVRIAAGVTTPAISRDGSLLVGITVGGNELVVLDL